MRNDIKTFEQWQASRMRVTNSDKEFKWIFKKWDIQGNEIYIYGYDEKDKTSLGYIKISKW